MSDSLKQAVEGMEVAWRRLREVLDGPDVAAALVERQAVRPMSTVPRDGTYVMLHLIDGEVVKCRWAGGWCDKFGPRCRAPGCIVGWSPVK